MLCLRMISEFFGTKATSGIYGLFLTGDRVPVCFRALSMTSAQIAAEWPTIRSSSAPVA